MHTVTGELRHQVVITRRSGHRCRNSKPEDQPSVVRNSQHYSQQTTPSFDTDLSNAWRRPWAEEAWRLPSGTNSSVSRIVKCESTMTVRTIALFQADSSQQRP